MHMEKGLQPAAEKPKDFSLFAEEFKKDYRNVQDLEARIAERWKFIEAEESAGRNEVAARIRTEVKTLEREILAARKRVETDAAWHRDSTETLRRMGPDDFPGHA